MMCPLLKHCTLFREFQHCSGLPNCTSGKHINRCIDFFS